MGKGALEQLLQGEGRIGQKIIGVARRGGPDGQIKKAKE